MSTARYALLVTPDRDTSDRFASLVAAFGLVVVVARDGAAAVAELGDRGAPAIAIVELALPALDGFAVIRALRASYSAVACPVVALSSNLALRSRAMDLRMTLRIDVVLSMQMPMTRIDQLVRPLLATRLIVPPALAVLSQDDTLSEAALQAQLATIARLFGVSSVLVALDGSGSPWLRAYHGEVGAHLAKLGTARDLAFCTPHVVTNAFESSVFAGHPLVAAGLIGSYVGVPLVSESGAVLGTLGVVDAGVWLGSPQVVHALQMEARRLATALVRPATPPQSFAEGTQPLGMFTGVQPIGTSRSPRLTPLRVAAPLPPRVRPARVRTRSG